MFAEELGGEVGWALELSTEAEGPLEPVLAQEALLAAKERQLQNVGNGVLGCGISQEGPLAPEKEALRRVAQSKLKYKKLKQKLAVLCEQIQDQGLVKDQKDVASPNKSRLVKLALELQKSLRTQAIDYPLVESLLREIQKIIEHRREHDIWILRGARVLSTLFTIIKRFPSLHRNEALQSAAALEMSLRLLRVMLALAANRECLLVNNQMIVLSSLLSCALMRDDRRTAVHALYLLNLLLAGPNRIQLHPLISTNLQYILCSSLLKRLKTSLETALQEDDPAYAEFLLLAFKFYHLILCLSCKQKLQRPIYCMRVGQDGLSKAISGYFQSGVQLLTQTVVELVLQCDEDEWLPREEDLPNFKINILLSVFKTLNIIFHVDTTLAQKAIQCTLSFLTALLFIFNYAKNYFQENVEVRRLCSEVIIFLGSLGFENYNYQQVIRTSGLMESLCNHPLDYLMEPALRNIIMPTYCCLIYNNPANFSLAFAESSAQPAIQFIEREMAFISERKSEEGTEVTLRSMPSRTLSRKNSVSSINSSYSKTSMAESFSTQTSNTLRFPDTQTRLDHRFRPECWEELLMQLRKAED